MIIPAAVIDEIVGWSLQGLSAYQITWGIGERFPQYRLRDVLLAVADHFRRAGEAGGVAIRGFCIEGYREIYRKALADDDLVTALKALARLERTAIG